MSSMSVVRGTRAAFAFLTRVPVGGFPYTDDEWRWSAAYFPLVGATVGAVVGCVDRALAPVGDLPAALGALAAAMLLTGAFHEDGLADTCDALGGAYDPQRVREILKDSRIGAFGASGLVVSIVGRAALMARLGPEAAWALPLVGAAARAGPVWQMAILPYVTAEGAARSTAVARAGHAQAWVATAWALALGAALVLAKHAVATRVLELFAVTAALTLLTGWRYRRRLGGVTGDFLGATEQVCELAALGVLVWR